MREKAKQNKNKEDSHSGQKKFELSWTHWKYCDILKLLRQNPEIDHDAYGAWLWYCLGSLTEARKLPGALWQWGGKKKESACNYVSGIWILPPIPLWLPVDWTLRFPPVSAKQKRARMYTNIEKHVIVSAKGSDVITDVISAYNQIFASTFSMQILKFQRRSYKLCVLFPSRRQSTTETLFAG